MFATRYVQIGAKIRYYRTIRSMDQTTLAEKLCVTRQYLSKLERGVAKPSMDLLFLIAQVLNVEVEQLIKNENNT